MHRCVFPVVMLALAVSAQAQDVTDPQIREAITAIQDYFWRTQDPQTGAWPQPPFDSGLQRGGDTALVVTALIASGISPQHARLGKSIDYLKQLDMTGTYAVAQRAHVWSNLSGDYHDLLLADGKWLLSAADREGRYGYTAGAAGGVNMSTTHYGILGLWEAAKRGAPQPKTYWTTAEKTIMDIQNRDGGWGYTPMQPSTGSMTSAGLIALLVARQRAHRTDMFPDPQVEQAINRGLDWLDKRFINHENIGNAAYTYYYLYALERVALASGTRRFNGKDWFQVGAHHILNNRGDDGAVGGSPINSAFAMLFLSRGRVPVWATKITIPDVACNQRPNDVYFLSDHMGDMREGELNWQLLNIDEPIDAWVDVPAAYLAAGQDIRFTDAQQQTLCEYIDLGGTLIVNPDNGSASIGRAIRRFAERNYPQWPMRELPLDHPIYTSLQGLDRGAGQKAFGVSNGVRELIVLADRDWGIHWQSLDDITKHPAGRIGANIWSIVTDRGLLRARLHRRFEPRRVPQTRPWEEPPPPPRRITVARVRYAGNWQPEPKAWPIFSDAFYNRTGCDLNVIDIDLEQIGATDAAMVHLCGVEPAELTVAELNAIGRYTNRGGTVFVETAGGAKGFGRDVERQLLPRFRIAAAPLSLDHPIITGQDLTGGSDCREVKYRRFAAVTMSLGFRPRLATMTIDDQPAVIYASEDLSQGMLRVNHWGVPGYDVESAERVMTNLILWSAGRKLEGASP